MRNWLLDRLVLSPSRHPIAAENKQRLTLNVPHGEFEVWVEHHPVPVEAQDVDLLVVKFPGTAGRAEKATTQPAEIWDALASEVWAINPPGYGQAKGRATLAATAPMVEELIERIQQRQCQRVLVVANSLGNLAALRLASRFPVNGLLLRNPPALADVVRHRGRTLKIGWLADWVANSVPAELDPHQNAAECDSPALFIHSELDRLVPLSLQQPIAQSYGGPKHSFVARGADHDCPIPESQTAEFLAALEWLRGHLFTDFTPTTPSPPECQEAHD